MIFIFNGCLYTTHHFNKGIPLPPGKSQFLLAGGNQTLWRCHSKPNDTLPTSAVCAEDPARSQNITASNIAKGSLDYRLGLFGKSSIFNGGELTWHFEIPTNPASMEFGFNAGLPGSGNWRHGLGIGWGIGAWADNSWFLQYALSRLLQKHSIYWNARFTWLATQLGDVLSQEFSSPLSSRQHWVLQSALGTSLNLPNWPLIPDEILPQFVFTFPQIPSGDTKFNARDIPIFQWNLNLGLAWEI